jgi:acetyl-CoA carboxylase carboxyltransferase component
MAGTFGEYYGRKIVRAIEFAKEMSGDENPYGTAERGFIDDIIMPRDTRKCIIRALESLKNKSVNRPWKKYSNINL